MTRTKTATLWELDCILHRATKLTDRNFTIFPPSDEEGNLLLDDTIDYYKKEIIKTIIQINICFETIKNHFWYNELGVLGC